jgi:rhomboid protease GluP
MRWNSRPFATPRSYLQNNTDTRVVVFRAVSRKACDERAFVLTAVNIASDVEPDGDEFVVLVEQAGRAHAAHHLWHYESERRRPAADLAPLWQPKPHAWRGSVIYMLLLLTLPLVISQGWFALDLFARGVLDPSRILSGEWWRLWTALSLHWDASHLLGNLAAGALLGFCVAQVWGNARGWLLILVAALIANLLESSLALPRYVSAGASTSVFAAVGLLCSHTWRTRRAAFQRRNIRRWAPLIVGVAVLALFGGGATGTGEPNSTNVLSHLLGFAAGVLLGAAASSKRGLRALDNTPPKIAALISLGSMLLAWVVAGLA